MIRLEGVSLRLGGRTVLDDVNFVVHERELVLLSGPRGAGKSVLCAIAAARQFPTVGAVWIGTRDVAALQRSSLPFVRRNIGYLPADAPLIGDETATENVMRALAVRGEPLEAARAQADKWLTRLGLVRVIAQPAYTLSYGERKLVALARALAGGCPLVVLDDPASGLQDADRERVVEALVAARDEGAAVLTASAEDEFAETLVARGARRIAIDEGKLGAGSAAISLVPPLESETPLESELSESDLLWEGENTVIERRRRSP